MMNGVIRLSKQCCNSHLNKIKKISGWELKRWVDWPGYCTLNDVNVLSVMQCV